MSCKIARPTFGRVGTPEGRLGRDSTKAFLTKTGAIGLRCVDVWDQGPWEDAIASFSDGLALGMGCDETDTYEVAFYCWQSVVPATRSPSPAASATSASSM